LTTILGATLLMIGASGCSFTEESLWPSLSGEDPAGGAAQEASVENTGVATAVPAVQTNAQPTLGTTNFVPTGVTPGQETGTFVGKKVIELRDELQNLQSAIGQHNQILQQVRAKVIADSQRYHNTIAAMNARLQVGTTPGNPILVQQFNNAQSDLDQIDGDITDMNRLGQAVANDSSMSAFLAESASAAFNVSGAVDEDHRQLAVLQDEVNRTVVLIERLHTEVSKDVRRQSAYISTERSNLNLLSSGIRSGEIYGISLVNQAMASAASGGSGNMAGNPLDTTGRRPLVVIRFDRTDIAYEQALYNAVKKVLERRPDATFDLVAVAPSHGDEATIALNSSKSRRNAENVLRSLVDMGLPPARVAVSGKTAGNTDVNEVHLYLR
jgi:hypothetical protein